MFLLGVKEMTLFENYTKDKRSLAPGTPVAVIATFKTDGAIKPLRIRFEDKEGPIEANIDTMLYAEKLLYDFYSFKCLITLNNVQRSIILTYKSDTNIWKVLWE